MRTKNLFLGVLAVCLLFSLIPITAQEATPEVFDPMRIELQTADNITLIGDLYGVTLDSQTPAILLMHMNGRRRGDWETLIPELTNAGYRVLTVDLRGHGESDGPRNWELAIGDVQAWLDWMRDQPAIDPARIAVMGGSIGSNLALVGCANDEQCVTAIALSPALDYFGVTTSDAIAALRERSVLLISSRSDLPSGSDVKTMVSDSRGEIGLQIYRGGTHGTNLLPLDGVIPLIMHWLDTHLQ